MKRAIFGAVGVLALACNTGAQTQSGNGNITAGDNAKIEGVTINVTQNVGTLPKGITDKSFRDLGIGARRAVLVESWGEPKYSAEISQESVGFPIDKRTYCRFESDSYTVQVIFDLGGAVDLFVVRVKGDALLRWGQHEDSTLNFVLGRTSLAGLDGFGTKQSARVCDLAGACSIEEFDFAKPGGYQEYHFIAATGSADSPLKADRTKAIPHAVLVTTSHGFKLSISPEEQKVFREFIDRLLSLSPHKWETG